MKIGPQNSLQQAVDGWAGYRIVTIVKGRIK